MKSLRLFSIFFALLVLSQNVWPMLSGQLAKFGRLAPVQLPVVLQKSPHLAGNVATVGSKSSHLSTNVKTEDILKAANDKPLLSASSTGLGSTRLLRTPKNMLPETRKADGTFFSHPTNYLYSNGSVNIKKINKALDLGQVTLIELFKACQDNMRLKKSMLSKKGVFATDQSKIDLFILAIKNEDYAVLKALIKDKSFLYRENSILPARIVRELVTQMFELYYSKKIRKQELEDVLSMFHKNSTLKNIDKPSMKSILIHSDEIRGIQDQVKQRFDQKKHDQIKLQSDSRQKKDDQLLDKGLVTEKIKKETDGKTSVEIRKVAKSNQFFTKKKVVKSSQNNEVSYSPIKKNRFSKDMLSALNREQLLNMITKVVVGGLAQQPSSQISLIYQAAIKKQLIVRPDYALMKQLVDREVVPYQDIIKSLGIIDPVQRDIEIYFGDVLQEYNVKLGNTTQLNFMNTLDLYSKTLQLCLQNQLKVPHEIVLRLSNDLQDLKNLKLFVVHYLIQSQPSRIYEIKAMSNDFDKAFQELVSEFEQFVQSLKSAGLIIGVVAAGAALVKVKKSLDRVSKAASSDLSTNETPFIDQGKDIGDYWNEQQWSEFDEKYESWWKMSTAELLDHINRMKANILIQVRQSPHKAKLFIDKLLDYISRKAKDFKVGSIAKYKHYQSKSFEYLDQAHNSLQNQRGNVIESYQTWLQGMKQKIDIDQVEQAA